MKMISKVACTALGLVLLGSSAFSQSLDDAKRAIDAEQYQKAKSMLTNLTVTQATKDENYFYLGWVYLVQDYPDSAKAIFMKGIAVNPKSALNYVGLGAAAHLNKDASGVSSNFTQASSFTGKKDSKPWVYMGAAYLLLPPGQKAVTTADANAAIAVLEKAKLANPKDAEALVVQGNANRALKNASAAYSNYGDALSLDPKNVNAFVSQGVLISNAQNFEDAEKEYQKAIAIDPNFGPAYREWAETDLYWAQTTKSVAVAKVNEAVEHYKKFLSLTDNSTESLLRYADFLYNAGDFKTLQEVAATLSKSANSNARVYRYIGYAAYENKDYPAGLSAMNSWFSKAEPSRILGADYLYLGRLQIASGKDTLAGIGNLKKAADMDTLKLEEIYAQIAAIYRAKKDYGNAAKTYEEIIDKVHGKALLQEHFYLGFNDYYAFRAQARAFKANPSSPKPDSALLTKADSALSYVQKKATTQLIYYPQYRALIADEKDGDYSHLQGLSKPYYEQIIQILSAKNPLPDADKSLLASAYAYLGNYYEYHDKDDAKALENFTKARDINPNNGYAKFYFDNKATATPPAKTGGTPPKK
ncbi:MAG: tetratricopeptide repeat protein [Mucilaginibacter sp.]